MSRNPRMTRRSLRTPVLSAAVATTLLLAACNGGGDDDNGGGGEGGGNEATGPITVWFSNNEQELAWGNAAVEAWNADNPDAEVTAQEIPAGSSSEEAITAAITAGTAPCLVYNISPAAAPQWQAQGGLVNLSGFDDGESYITERGGDITAGYTADDGGYYQIPWKSNPVMVMYNKEIFTEAGLNADDPSMATYEEFLAAANQIVDSGAADSAIWPSPTSEFYQPWFDFYPLYAAVTGGTLLVEDGASTFNDDNGRAVMEFWAQIYSDGLAPQEASSDDAMAAGTTAMQVAGPWAIAAYDGAIDVGFMPVPTPTGIPAEETYTFADAKNISMFTSCENQGTAWEFLKFTTSQEQDGELLAATGQMPMRAGLEDAYSDYFSENPDYVDFASQAQRTIDVPSVPNSIEIWQTFRDQYSSAVIFGDTSVDDALNNAATEIDSLASQ